MSDISPSLPNAANVAADLVSALSVLRNATPGRLEVWTSCSWRRVMADDAPFIVPCVDKDGHPNMDSMDNIEAAVAAVNFLRAHGAAIRDALASQTDGLAAFYRDSLVDMRQRELIANGMGISEARAQAESDLQAKEQAHLASRAPQEASASIADAAANVGYDRVLIAEMLDDLLQSPAQSTFTREAIAEQARLVREAEDADAAGVHTAARTNDQPYDEECAATGQGHSMRPCGPRGEVQCQYCGEAPPVGDGVVAWMVTESGAAHYPYLTREQADAEAGVYPSDVEVQVRPLIYGDGAAVATVKGYRDGSSVQLHWHSKPVAVGTQLFARPHTTAAGSVAPE